MNGNTFIVIISFSVFCALYRLFRLLNENVLTECDTKMKLDDQTATIYGA